jgi:hypothetical protein
MSEFIDSYTETGAWILVRRIKAYWQLQGYPKIEAWIEPGRVMLQANVVQLWKIKSNLNERGYPPK